MDNEIEIEQPDLLTDDLVKRLPDWDLEPPFETVGGTQ